MFKDTFNGSTHFQNDGCGEQAHNMKTIQTILDEFEKEFPRFTGVGARHPIFNETPVYTHIIQFIRQALTQQLDELKGKIEGMKFPEINGGSKELPYKEYPTAKPIHESDDVLQQFYYNQALKDILTLIDSMK